MLRIGGAAKELDLRTVFGFGQVLLVAGDAVVGGACAHAEGGEEGEGERAEKAGAHDASKQRTNCADIEHLCSP